MKICNEIKGPPTSSKSPLLRPLLRHLQLLLKHGNFPRLLLHNAHQADNLIFFVGAV
jgi:hypothetical protein